MAQCLHLRPEIVADSANHNRLTNIKQQQQQQTKQKNKQTNKPNKQTTTNMLWSLWCRTPKGLIPGKIRSDAMIVSDA